MFLNKIQMKRTTDELTALLHRIALTRVFSDKSPANENRSKKSVSQQTSSKPISRKRWVVLNSRASLKGIVFLP